jgi:DNA topoisomerase I
VPLAARPSGKKPPKASETAIGESEDSDVPLGQKLSKQKAKIEKAADKDARAARRDSMKQPTSSGKKHTIEDSDDDIPLKKKRPSAATPSKAAPAKPAPAKPAPAKKNKPVKKEESDDDIPLSRKASKKLKPSASVTSTPVKKGKAPAKKDEDDDDDEEEYRWWENPMQGDGTTKWTTLEHSGVVFPPPYELLPKNVKMKYDGAPVTMAPDAEEVAGFFGGMLNSTHNVENPTFQKNFFHDFQQILRETGGAKDRDGNKVAIKEFRKCDFKPIFEYYDAEREKKKALPAAEKKAIKAEKDVAEAPYMYCMWDSRKQKVGNFRVEPPGLFRGRGEHPKTGHVKKRVQPEQITINIGKEAKVPPPPEGHRWKEVKHDQEGTWLAMWQENINGNYKYVMLAANADIKGQSDYKKFEKARELKVCDCSD